MVQRYGLIKFVIPQQLLVGKAVTQQLHAMNGVGLFTHTLAVNKQWVIVFIQQMPFFLRNFAFVIRPAHQESIIL